MGYRSEVVLVVGKEVMPQFMVTMAKSSDARALCVLQKQTSDMKTMTAKAICYSRGIVSSGTILTRVLLLLATSLTGAMAKMCRARTPKANE